MEGADPHQQTSGVAEAHLAEAAIETQELRRRLGCPILFGGHGVRRQVSNLALEREEAQTIFEIRALDVRFLRQNLLMQLGDWHRAAATQFRMAMKGVDHLEPEPKIIPSGPSHLGLVRYVCRTRALLAAAAMKVDQARDRGDPPHAMRQDGILGLFPAVHE